MPLAYLISIVDSTLVYTVVICHFGTFDKCICRIYNDIINYYCYTKCQNASVRVHAIVTVARAVQNLKVIGIHSAFSRISSECYYINLYINSCCHFCYSVKYICAVFMYLFFLSNFPSLAQKIIAKTSSSLV